MATSPNVTLNFKEQRFISLEQRLKAVSAYLRPNTQHRLDSAGWNALTSIRLEEQFGISGNLYCNYILDIHERVQHRYRRDGDVSALRAFMEGTVIKYALNSDQNLKPLMMVRYDLNKSLAHSISKHQEYFIQPHDRKIIRNKKKRVGLILKHYNNDPETLGALAFANREFCQKSGFDVTFLFLASIGDHKILQVFASNAPTIFLPNSLDQSISSIRNLNLDILFSMNDSVVRLSQLSLLNCFQLSKLRFINLSTNLTTASPHVQYFFATSYYQERKFQKEYTEQFAIVDAPGFSIKSERKASLSKHQNILENTICSLANMKKLNLETLSMYARILNQCPKFHLHFYPFPPHYGSTESETLSKIVSDIFLQFSIGTDRYTIERSQGSRSAFLKAISRHFLAIDSYPYPGVTTVADCLDAQIPIVCLDGASLRNTQGINILRTMSEHISKWVTSIENAPALLKKIHDCQQYANEWRRSFVSVAAQTRIFDEEKFSQSVAQILTEVE